MLGYDLSRPPELSDGATVAVLLHGRGSHRGDLQALRPNLPDRWALITPQAPHPGHPWGYGPGWAWYRYIEEDRVMDASLSASLRQLDDFLRALPGILGIAPGRLVLGGFSQGGTMSMAYALTRPGTVHAALNFSGFLADTPIIEAEMMGPDATPIFWAHGTRDPNIPFALATRGRATLNRAGSSLTTTDHAIGHWIDPAGVSAAVDFVEAIAAR